MFATSPIPVPCLDKGRLQILGLQILDVSLGSFRTDGVYSWRQSINFPSVSKGEDLGRFDMAAIIGGWRLIESTPVWA